MDDAVVLARALGKERAIEEIETRLANAGGLNAAYVAGASAFGLPRLATRRLDAIFALATRLLAPPEWPACIESAEDVAKFMRPRLALLTYESFWVVMLDARGRALGVAEVARGTLTACLVHPREVFRPALTRGAARIIAVHNHPSGDVAPSEEDRALTIRLAECGALLGIPLVDHVVVGRSGFSSLGADVDRDWVATFGTT